MNFHIRFLIMRQTGRDFKENHYAFERPAPVDIIPPVIELIGGDVLGHWGRFTEPGYVATDDVDGDLTSQVVVKGKVDAEKPGNYSIFYSVQDMAGNNSALVKRTVIISPLVTDNIPPKLVLFGSETIYHVVNEPYFEPGYEAIDSNDGVITSKVEIVGDFNSSKAGTYELFYSVSDNTEANPHLKGNFFRRIRLPQDRT